MALGQLTGGPPGGRPAGSGLPRRELTWRKLTCSEARRDLTRGRLARDLTGPHPTGRGLAWTGHTGTRLTRAILTWSCLAGTGRAHARLTLAMLTPSGLARAGLTSAGLAAADLTCAGLA
jgi:uncharacterized protein YjbI with pentapeptide repeats